MAERESPPPCRTLGDYFTPVARSTMSIVMPPVAAHNFEIKPALVRLVQHDQFGGGATEDPYLHIDNFLLLCDTCKLNGVTDDAIRLRLFPFSLRDKAKCWLYSLPQGSITTWEDLNAKFLSRFFPWSKYYELKAEISCFAQKENEPLYEAWERFKELLRRCRQHGLEDCEQVEIFFNGMTPSSRMIINVSAGGSLKFKTPKESLELFEAMASDEYESVSMQPKKEMMQLEAAYDVILAQNKLLSQQLDAITKQLEASHIFAVNSQPPVCDMCGGGHANGDCEASGASKSAQANYMGNAPRNQNNLYNNTYNSGWSNYPSLSYKPQQQQMQQGSSSNLENALLQPTQETQSFMQETQSSFKNQETSIHSPDLSFSISHSLPAKSASMSIYTKEVRCYCQSPSNSHYEHDVAFSNDVVLTCTITNSQFVVDEWISKTKSSHPLLVGLDTEWRPFGQNNPVATLQLCVGHRCLIFQLLYALDVPRSLREFLSDSSNTFVGVGVDNDAQKLMNNYGLKVSTTVDLARLARTRLRLMNGNSLGLKFLAYQVLGVDIDKPKNITLSRWDYRWLSHEQVQYAAIDAYVSFEIGRVWRAWEESQWFWTMYMDD